MQANFISRSNRTSSAGFTLLELLVVIVIVSILVTYSTLAIRGSSPEDLIKEEALRLQTLTQLVMEESILRGEEYGIEVFQDGYRFVRFSDDQWVTLDDDRILRDRELPADIELEMRLEETDIVIGVVSDPMSDNEVELNETEEVSSEEEQEKISPHIYILSSGEITPEFEIRFYILGVETSYLVTGVFDGTLNSEISDL
jgi:general secretion pathway protein H